MLDFLWSLLGFVIVIGLLVSIHEWGHYQAARWFNIKVTEFSIGFGKVLYQKQGKETCFQIALIPLGGFVKFVDEREGPVAEEDLPRAFNRQNVYKRFAVVAAGPLINLLFAWLVFTVVYMIGITGVKPIIQQVEPQSLIAQAAHKLDRSIFTTDQAWSVIEVNQAPVHSWQMVHEAVLQALVSKESLLEVKIENIVTQRSVLLPSISLVTLDINRPEQNWLKSLGFEPAQILLPPVLGKVLEGGPAALAGLKSGDLILEINQQAIKHWQDLVALIKNQPGENIDVRYQRLGAVYSAQIKLDAITLESGLVVGKMGVGVAVSQEILTAYTSTVQYGLLGAIKEGFQHNIDLIQMSLVMLKRMVIGEVSLENLSGPLSIAQFSGQALQTGVISFLSLLGLLSLSLGILNLLPIPVLDGGHLVYYLIEMIKGSPVSERVMMVGQSLGLFFIVGLTIVALFNDVVRISNG